MVVSENRTSSHWMDTSMSSFVVQKVVVTIAITSKINDGCIIYKLQEHVERPQINNKDDIRSVRFHLNHVSKLLTYLNLLAGFHREFKVIRCFENQDDGAPKTKSAHLLSCN